MATGNHPLSHGGIGAAKSVNLSPDILAELDALAADSNWRRPWTAEELEIVEAARDRGLTCKQIAEYLTKRCPPGRTTAAVKSILSR